MEKILTRLRVWVPSKKGASVRVLNLRNPLTYVYLLVVLCVYLLAFMLVALEKFTLVALDNFYRDVRDRI